MFLLSVWSNFSDSDKATYGDVLKWPYQLKMGSGAQGITLLKDVPIWYELWRNINGFPPDYYKINQATVTQNDKAKK